jgi:serine/threonine protein phosphatase PrpC
LATGDWVLLSTDGLLPRFRDEILRINQNNLPMEQAAQEVNALIESARSKDNISILLGIIN